MADVTMCIVYRQNKVQRFKGAKCKGAKLTAKKNKVTSKQTSKQTNIVTSSLLELLVAAKNSQEQECSKYSETCKKVKTLK